MVVWHMRIKGLAIQLITALKPLKEQQQENEAEKNSKS